MTDKTATQRTLFKGGVVLTMDANLGDLPCGDVLVEGSRILAVGVDLSADGARVIDAAGTILMPGFVNPHQHAWLGLMRGLMPNVDKLDDYMQALPFALGRHYRPQDMHAATLLTSLSCLDAGITSVLDASHNTLTPEHSDAAIQAFEQAGLRTLHMVGKPVGMPVAHWPHDLERLSVGRAAKDENLVSVGLFAQVPDAEQWAVARKLGVRILTEFVGGFGPSPLPDLKAKGLLGADNVFNHCCRLSDEDWRTLAEAGVNVTVNPRSDALFGLEAGGFPYQTALEHGLRPALGIDIDTSLSGDMFGEMRAAFFQQRAFVQARRAAGEQSVPPAVNVRAILEAATLDGARCMGLQDRIGSLTPGKQADLIMIRTDGVGVFPSHNAIGTVVHMVERADVCTVMVAGKLRKHEGRLVDVDLVAIRKAAQQSREYLFAATGYTPDVLEETFPALQPAG